MILLERLSCILCLPQESLCDDGVGLSNDLIASVVFVWPIPCNPAWTQHGKKMAFKSVPSETTERETYCKTKDMELTKESERKRLLIWNCKNISWWLVNHSYRCVPLRFRMMSERSLIKSDQYEAGTQQDENMQSKYCLLRFITARKSNWLYLALPLATICFMHVKTWGAT